VTSFHIPLARWWKLVEPPVPSRMWVREHNGHWELVADGTTIGVVYSEAAGRWIHAVHQALPDMLVELEDALYVRDLTLSRLRQVSRQAADAIWHQELLQPWTIDLGSTVERMLAEGRLGPDEE
jgi:hypothetical protein